MTVYRIQWRTTDGDHYADRDTEGAAELFAQHVIYAVTINNQGEAA